MPETMSSGSEAEYILGHSGREIRRLMHQAAMLRPITERLLRNAGISSGMRVLDLGCGAGDVAILAAELVGASGSVVGIDRNPDVLAVARERAQAAGSHRIDFREAAVDGFPDSESFDAVVGRYVLIHQSDPAAFLRTAARLARPGGIIAFHEICINGVGTQSLPHVPLWQQAGEWIRTAFQAVIPHYDAGGRLIEHFSRAGLPQPNLFAESVIGGGTNSPLYAWMAGTLESVLPQLVKMQIVNADAVGIETIESRLRAAVVEARSQIVGPLQFCAWTVV